MGTLTHCLPSASDMVKFGVVLGLSSDHFGLSSMPKLNFSVTNHAVVVAIGSWGTFGVVLSHTLQMKEVCLLGLGFMGMECCAVIADELQAEFIYEHVEGAKVVVPPLVQVCNLVVLVHGSHVPATRGKVRVSGGRTFMQNCVKKARSSLTWCSQPQAVARSTVQACPPHACLQWTLSSGHGDDTQTSQHQNSYRP